MDEALQEPKMFVKIPEIIQELDHSTCHSIPCEIQYNGEAPVSTYFKVREEETPDDIKESSQTLSSSYRGRCLKGQQVVIPEGYEAVVLVDDEVSSNNLDVKEMEVHKRFTGFTLWNWDHTPSADDKTMRAMNDWIAVSAALHTQSEQ